MFSKKVLPLNKGVFYLIVAITWLSFMDLAVKRVAPHYPLIQLVFFRSFFSFLPLLYVFYKTPHFKEHLKTHKMFSHFMRAVLGVMAIMGFSHGFGTMPLANVYAVEFASPFFMLMFSALIFREKITSSRWIAVAVGFLGVLIIVQPGTKGFHISALSVLAASFLFAWNAIHTRLLSETDTQEAIVFYFFLYCCLISGCFLPFVFVTPTVQDFFLMMGLGFCGGIGQIYMAKAFAETSVGILAPFYYLIMVFGVFFGWLFWQEIPQIHVILGSVIIILCGLYTHYQTQKTTKNP